MITPDQQQQLDQMTQSAGFTPPPQTNNAWAAFDQMTNHQTNPQKQQSSGPGFFQQIGNAFKGGVSQVKEGLDQINSGNGNPVDFGEGILKMGSGAASALASPVAPVMNKTVTPVMNAAADKISDNPTVQKFADSQAGQVTSRVAEDTANAANIAGTVGGGMEAPEAATAVSDTAKAGLDTAKSAVSDVADKAKSLVQKSPAKLQQETTAKTWDMVQPKLSPTELANAVKNGEITKSGKLGTITQVAKGRNAEMVEAAKPYVANAKDPLEAVTNMQQGIEDEAAHLKEQLNKTGASYTKSQIKGKLDELEAPTMVSSDATLSRVYTQVKNKMMTLVGKGGNLGDLLGARKQFDAFINKQFPNLYNSDTLTPMRQAIKDVRSTINDTIDERLQNNINPQAEELGHKINELNKQYVEKPTAANFKALNLAKDAYKESTNTVIDRLSATKFRDSLKHQSLLYDAIDNTAPKVGKIGSNAIDRFMTKHPTVATVGKGAARAVGIGAGVHLVP